MEKKYNPTLEINLIDLLEKAFDAEKADKLRPVISQADFKNLFGRRMVDYIVERTRKGKNASGDSMGTYSGSYKDSLIFKIYKGRQSKVDLTLTGEMLDTMNHRNGKHTITIQLEGDENRAKAQGHITGVYGKNKRIKSDRDFLGESGKITQKQIEIFKQAMADYRSNSLLLQAELEAF